MSAQTKLGIVGLSTKGSWASFTHLGALRSPALASSYTVTASSGSTPESSAAAVKKYSEEGKSALTVHHGSTQSIASDLNVDLVLVSLKSPWHKAAVMPVIAQGKNMFVEWPAGNSLDETKDMAQAVKAKGIKSMIGAQSWQVPAGRKVCPP